MAMQEKVKQTSETKNGNLNRSTPPPPSKDEGPKSAGKTNDECATLRLGNMPKAEAVTTVDRDKNKGTCVKAADRQNHSDEKYGKDGLNQPPAGRNFPTFVAVEDD